MVRGRVVKKSSPVKESEEAISSKAAIRQYVIQRPAQTYSVGDVLKHVAVYDDSEILDFLITINRDYCITESMDESFIHAVMISRGPKVMDWLYKNKKDLVQRYKLAKANGTLHSILQIQNAFDV